MSASLVSGSKIKIKSDIFSKEEGEKLHILTFSSEHLVTLDEQGKEIWGLLKVSEELVFSELLEICENDYENFGSEEKAWISEFLLELHNLGLVTFS